MNRQIKFRAMQKHGVRQGAWWYGYFSKDATGTAYITTLDGVDTAIVDEATIGQFTGLTDKNGTDIFEGDRVKHNNNVFFVRYSSNRHVLVLKLENDKGQNWRELEWLGRVRKYVTVLGNIHQGSEVTNGKAD